MSLCSIRERTRRAAERRNELREQGWTQESVEAWRRESTDLWRDADEWEIKAEMEKRIVKRGWGEPPQERKTG